MSNVRINHDGPTGAQQLGKTSPSARSKLRTIASRTGSGGDQVEISPLLEQVGEVLAAAETAPGACGNWRSIRAASIGWTAGN
jgi:hypothetical protein